MAPKWTKVSLWWAAVNELGKKLDEIGRAVGEVLEGMQVLRADSAVAARTLYSLNADCTAGAARLNRCVEGMEEASSGEPGAESEAAAAVQAVVREEMAVLRRGWVVGHGSSRAGDHAALMARFDRLDAELSAKLEAQGATQQAEVKAAALQVAGLLRGLEAKVDERFKEIKTDLTSLRKELKASAEEAAAALKTKLDKGFAKGDAAAAAQAAALVQGLAECRDLCRRSAAGSMSAEEAEALVRSVAFSVGTILSEVSTELKEAQGKGFAAVEKQ